MIVNVGVNSFLTSCTMQTPLVGYSFRDEPEECYYAYPSTAQQRTALLIHCEAVETRDDGTEQLVDVVIYKNSERISSDRPPGGLLPLSTMGYITGILITPVRVEDSGSTYQCKVEVNGEEVLSSLQITLYVGGETMKAAVDS